MKNNLVYGIIIFLVYMVLTFILRYVSGKFPENAEIFGIYQKGDFIIGIAIAVILVYSRYIKRNSTKK